MLIFLVNYELLNDFFSVIEKGYDKYVSNFISQNSGLGMIDPLYIEDMLVLSTATIRFAQRALMKLIPQGIKRVLINQLLN